MSSSAYENITARLREIQWIASTGSLLSWDQETLLPEAASPYRSEQLAFLDGWAHRHATDDSFRALLEAAEALDFPADSPQAVNIREIRRAFNRAVRLPTSLVEEFTRTSSQAHVAWVSARKASDFSLFAPFLERLLELTRQKAECWGYTNEIYDALLEGHEPGISTREVASLLDNLAREQTLLLREIQNKEPALPPSDTSRLEFPIHSQQQFNREVAAAFGFDFSAGRIDSSAHPFCTTLGPRDIRLTTRYDLHDFTNSLYSVLHEAGHGLYEQGLPHESFGLPTGQAVSLGVHESQSRLWENKVGRTRSFWEHWLPRAIEIFPNAASLSLEEISSQILRVRPSFIRVEADEVSYDLHIVLRFELERALLRGELAVADLPEAWNSRFAEIFGIEVPDDSRGCLQDIHWSMGGFGYFPTYSLGNIFSAQIFDAASRQIPSLHSDLANGDYAPLLDWLRENIHRHGMTWPAPALIERATGTPPSTAPHLANLREKYLARS